MTNEYTPTTDKVRHAYVNWFGSSAERVRLLMGSAFDRWLAAHDAEIRAERDSLARLHEVATERTVQLAAVIEKARVALDGMDVYQYEADSTYIHDVRKALDSDTSALREVRAKEWDEGWDACANWWEIHHHSQVRDESNPHRETGDDSGERALSGWKPGDPCGSCGSTKTGWNPADGGTCNGCGRTDADE